MINIDFTKEPKEVVDYLKNKGLKTTFDYTEMMHEAHHASFTVAKVTRLDLLSDIHESLQDAFKNGKKFEQWKKEISPTLQAKGWLGNVTAINPLTGEVKDIYVGSRRLKTIYDTNMRTAYAQARYKSQMQGDSEFWRYTSILDSRLREKHRAMHGTILHRTHPFWKKNYPPNGWRCRCRVNAYTKEAMDAKGWEESKGKFSDIADKDWAYDMGDSGIERAWKQKLGSAKKTDIAELAKKEAIFDANTFKAWFDAPTESFGVAKASPFIQETLNTQASDIFLSHATMQKQKEKHNDIAWHEYLLLNSIFEKPLLVVKDSGFTTIAIKSFLEDVYYYAVLKATKTRKALFVTSFRKTKDLDKVTQKGEVLLDER